MRGTARVGVFGNVRSANGHVPGMKFALPGAGSPGAILPGVQTAQHLGAEFEWLSWCPFFAISWLQFGASERKAGEQLGERIMRVHSET